METQTHATQGEPAPDLGQDSFRADGMDSEGSGGLAVGCPWMAGSPRLHGLDLGNVFGSWGVAPERLYSVIELMRIEPSKCFLKLYLLFIEAQ